MRRQPAIALGDEVGEHRAVAILDDRALGYGNQKVLARVAVLAATGAVRPARRLAVGVIAERDERRHIAIGDEPDVAARAPVTAVGAALGRVGLTAERDAARATVATFHIETGLIDEVRHGLSVGGASRPPVWRYLVRWTGSPMMRTDHVDRSFTAEEKL